MIKSLNFFLYTLILIGLLQAPFVQANLLISPTKVTFDDRERSQQLILINSGDETRTYRVSWKERKSLPTGGGEELSEQEVKDFPIASKMIRYSPKQVTLKAGERQVIKLAVRRPKGLDDGEYRSYLLLTALPTKNSLSKKNTFSAQLNVLLNYSLPVIVRQGAASKPEIGIDSIKLGYAERKADSYIEKQKKDAFIDVAINRSGLYSVTGNLIVYWQGNDDKSEKIVAQLHRTPIYPEVAQAKIKLKWSDAQITAGQLRVSYQGIEKNSGDILAERIFEVTPSMFNKIDN